MTIKRLEIDWADCEIVEDSEGSLVDYDAHIKEIDDLKGEIEHLRNDLRKYTFILIKIKESIKNF